jgi:hypothetical protein
MNAAVLLVAVAATASQIANPIQKEIIKTDATLQPADVVSVLAAARAAIAGRTLRLLHADDDRGLVLMEVTVGADGRPRFIRRDISYDSGTVGAFVAGGGNPVTTYVHVDATLVTEFTGRPVRGCDGTPRDGELIVDYTNEGRGWTAAAKSHPAPGDLPAVFDMLTGAVTATSGTRAQVGARPARGLVAPWTPPAARSAAPMLIGDPLPNIRRDALPSKPASQTLWIDVDSLLPLQWNAEPLALRFDYDGTSVIARPDGVTPPDCVR